MEKTQHASNSRSLCEKIKFSITSSPALQSGGRTTTHPQDFMATQLSPPANNPSNNRKVPVAIPIEFDSSAFSTTKDEENNSKPSKYRIESAPTKEGSAGKGKPVKVKGGEGKKSDTDNVNDKFSEYIKRAKIKISRTTSEVDNGKRISRLDSVNQKFSAYINRAKAKMSKTFKGRE